MNRPPAPLPKGSIEFLNVWPNATVSCRLTIVHGQIAGLSPNTIAVTSRCKANSEADYPQFQVPVVEGYFKAVVPLSRGSNEVIFDTGSTVQTLVLNYKPILEDPPIHFVLLVAKDSPGMFDAPPGQPNTIPEAVRKLRLASYLMASFTQEQMSRNSCGMRTFRPFEAEEPCTVSAYDKYGASHKRWTTHVHVIKLDKTVAEVRDPDVAQQNSSAKRSGDLYGMAADALRTYGGPFTQGFSQAACIFLDTHWDPQRKLVLGHAALGGNAGNVRLAIFGSHGMHAWPSCLEELPTRFMDTTPTDTRVVANDANQSGTHWEALNVSMGAFMHEIGHLLGCPHEPSGVMLRGYLNWNRSFMACEAYSSREKRQCLTCARSQDEDYWHRLDICRFRYHPSFALPGEPPLISAKSIAYPMADGVGLTCPAGVYLVELRVKDETRAHFEFPLAQSVQVKLSDIEAALPSEFIKGRVDLVVHSPIMEQMTIEDVRDFIKHNVGPDGLMRSSIAGVQNGREQRVLLPDKPLRYARIHSGDALDGIEFIYEDDSSVLFGSRGGSPHTIETRGQELLGIAVRCGAWIDAGGIITTAGRSLMFGGSGGGTVELVPPPGRKIRGLMGWFTSWCVGLAILYDG